MLEVQIDSAFNGHIVSQAKGQLVDSKFRSYDHRGRGYGWVPSRNDLEWVIDVECCQGRDTVPLFPGQKEMAFLCGWTRCEVIAKFMEIPVWLTWKKVKNYIFYEPGYQTVFIENQRLVIYTGIHNDMVFSLAYAGRLR